MEKIPLCIIMFLEGDTEVEKLKFEGQNDRHIKFTKLYMVLWKLTSVNTIGDNEL